MYKLKTVGPPYESFLLKTGAYRIGSASDSEMVVRDTSVAPHHCEIVVTAKTIAVRDLSSNHEMYVDGERLEYAHLQLGQTLRLGEVKLVLEEAASEVAVGSSPSGHTQVHTPSVVKTSARFFKRLALPGLALIGFGAIGTLIWFSTRQESRSPEQSLSGAASPASRVRKKKAEETADRERRGAAEAPSRGVSVPNPPETRNAASSGSNAANPGTARSPRERSESPKQAFDPNDSSRPPALDVKDAGLHIRKGEYARAEPLLQRALRNQQKTLGPEHPDVTRTLDTLGRLYQNAQQYDKAEPCLQQVVRNIQKVRGPGHPETAAALDNLGELYLKAGQYAKAKPALELALKIREKTLPPDHPDVGASLNNLAALNRAQGEYAKAKPLLERALKIFEASPGTNNLRAAQCANDLGDLHRSMHDDAKAEESLQRALTLKEQTLPPDDPSLAATLNSLAAIQASRGEYAKAEPLYQRALKIAEKAFGSDHPETAASLDNLAGLHQKMGDYAKAKPLYERAAKIAEKALGPEHPQTGSSLNNLALLHQAMGDPGQADPLFQRASKILDNALGPEHPQTVTSLANWAGLHVCQGDQALGLQLAKQAVDAKLKLLAAVVTCGSDQQRIAYRDRLNPYSLAASLELVPELAQAILRSKGLVLDSLLEDRLVARAGANPGARALVEEFRSAKARLAQLILELPRDSSPPARERRQAEKARLATEVELLEDGLARYAAGIGRTRRDLSVTVEQVQAAIPEQAVLLELARYSHCLGTDRWEPRYGAVILASTGKAKWVPLGSAEVIEKNLAAYQTAVRRGSVEERGASGPQSNETASRRVGDSASGLPKSDVQSLKPAASANSESQIANRKSEIQNQSFSSLLQALYQQLWGPIEPALPPGTKTVIISPDAALSFVSFSSLLTPDDQFLCQKYSIRYVSSGRDLLAEKKPPSRGPVYILCNADFGNQEWTATAGSVSDPSAIRFFDRQDLQALRLPPVPETLHEAALLEARAKKWNWPVQVLGGGGASETQLAAINSPRILHLATHAFVLPESGAAEETELRTGEANKLSLEPGPMTASIVDEAGPASGSGAAGPVFRRNPIHRSGVVLAGGKATLQAWDRGEVPQSSNDGIVTADEAGGLKLEGTELVVLSARDAEIGSAKSGEALLGLRRAFAQSGAKNLLITLWPVADPTIAEMLSDFYDRFHENDNAPRALDEVQREWLVKLRKERGVDMAVRLAGSFVLNSRGRL